MTLDEISKSLGLRKKENRGSTLTYGTVSKINQDRTYEVKIAGADVATTCARLAGADIGDTVMVAITKTGYAVVIARLGGDLDAVDAAKTATNFVTAQTENGQIFVHPEGDTQSGVLIGQDIKIIRAGVAVATYSDSVKIGQDPRIEIGDDNIEFYKHGKKAFCIGTEDTNPYDEKYDWYTEGRTFDWYKNAPLIFKYYSGAVTEDPTFSLLYDPETMAASYSGDYFGFTRANSSTSADMYTYTITKAGSSSTTQLVRVEFCRHSDESPHFTFGTREQAGYKNGAFSTSIGIGNLVTGSVGTAVGEENKVKNRSGIAIGRDNELTAHRCIAVGNSNSCARHDSIAIGIGLETNNDGTTFIGTYNEKEIGGNAEATVIFGAGDSDSDRKTVLAIGKITRAYCDIITTGRMQSAQEYKEIQMTNGTSGAIALHRKGDIVSVYMQGAKLYGGASDRLIATLPEGFKPPRQTMVQLGSSADGLIFIDSDGSVRCRHTSATLQQVWGYATYVAWH